MVPLTFDVRSWPRLLLAWRRRPDVIAAAPGFMGEMVACLVAGGAYWALSFALVGLPLAAAYGFVQADEWMRLSPASGGGSPAGILTSWWLHNSVAHLRTNVLTSSFTMAVLTFLLLPRGEGVLAALERGGWTSRQPGLAVRHLVIPTVALLALCIAIGLTVDTLSWLTSPPSFTDADGRTIRIRSVGFSGVCFGLVGALAATLAATAGKRASDPRWIAAALVGACLVGMVIGDELPHLWLPRLPGPEGAYTDHLAHLVGFGTGAALACLLFGRGWIRNRLLFPDGRRAVTTTAPAPE